MGLRGGTSRVGRAFANVAIVAMLATTAVAFLLTAWGSPSFAIDFRSVTPEIRGLAHGTNPYVTAGMQERGHFLWSVLAGWLLAPFAWMPYGWAAVTALGLVAIPVTARLLGVRDWRVWALAAAWPATVNGAQTANITMLVAVLVALGWWDRVRARCGLWVGLAVAVKLFAWPTLVWLAATRRWRAFWVASGIQAAGLLLTVPYVSLADFARYEREADRVFSDEAITLSALLHGLGVPGARALAVAAGLALLWWGRRDLGWCVVAALALSPIVWLHYFQLLILPLSLWSAPLWVWLLPFGLGVAPGSGNGGAWHTAVALAVVAATVVAAWLRSAGAIRGHSTPAVLAASREVG